MIAITVAVLLLTLTLAIVGILTLEKFTNAMRSKIDNLYLISEIYQFPQKSVTQTDFERVFAEATNERDE